MEAALTKSVPPLCYPGLLLWLLFICSFSPRSMIPQCTKSSHQPTLHQSWNGSTLQDKGPGWATSIHQGSNTPDRSLQ